MTDRDTKPPSLRSLLEELKPQGRAGGSEPSEPRLHIRNNFDTLAAARGRSVSWQQIADTMHQAGIRGMHGTVLDGRQVKSLYHAERYARGGKRKRQVGPSIERRPRVAKQQKPAPPTRPAPTNNLVNPYAEMDQQQAARKQRQERVGRLTSDSFFTITSKTETE